MDKRLLEKITSPYSDEQIIDAAKTREPAGVQPYDHPWFTSAWIANVGGEKLLVFDIHALKDLQNNDFRYIAGMRMFIWSDSFITRVYTGVYKSKWITGTLATIEGYCGYFKGYVDKASMNAFRDFFDSPDSDDPIRLVYKFQSNISQIRLAAEHARILKRIDAEMSLIPEIPSTFGSWVEEIALYQSRYIFYRYEKGRSKLKGYCTHCKQSVTVTGAKHNLSGVCPACKSKITFKAIGKTAPIHDRGYAYLLQRMRDGRMVLRIFFVYKSYGSPKGDRLYLSAKSSYGEVVRGVFRKDFKNPTPESSIKWYEWTDFKSSGVVRWCDDCSRHTITDGALYTRNLSQVLRGTPWQYSKIQDMAVHETGYQFDWIAFLRRSKEEPIIEYLVKAKLWNLTAGFINRVSSSIDRNAKRLHQALGVTKDQLPILQKMDVSWSELRIFKTCAAFGIPLKPEEISFLEKSNVPEGALKYLKRTTPHRLIRYATEAKHPHFFHDWYDYLKACELLEIDTHSEFVLFPKNFKEAHDTRTKEAAAVKSAGLDQVAEKRFAAICPLITDTMRKLPKKYSEYRIVTPKCAKDVRDEGTALQHCVGNYVERIADGETMILFVRSVTDLEKPLYTAEFRDGKVVQCRGYMNSMDNPVPPIVIELTRWFEDAFRAIQLGKEERASCA